jgi:glycosyltransferase involved in cell wall biosynthesis
MPNYCKAAYIGQAIESVRTQTFEDFELIIVDDFSADNSKEICKDCMRTDTRIRILERKERHGVSSARNMGIRAAKGGYVAFIDSDDLYSPVKLEHQYNALASAAKPTVAYCDWWRIDDKGETLPPGRRPHPTSSGMIFGDAISLGFGVNVMLMALRAALMSVGLYDTSLPWGEDFDLLLKLARVYPFTYVGEKLYGYRFHLGNTRSIMDRRSRLLYEAKIIEEHLRGSERLLTANQRSLVRRRLLDNYAKTNKYMKLVKERLNELVS